MSVGVVLWGVVLAMLGLNIALVAWFILRFWAGAIAAMAGFYAVLLATCWSITSLLP